MDEDFFWLKVSELSLKKMWDNEFDERWNALNSLVESSGIGESK